MANRSDIYNWALSMCRAATIDDPDGTTRDAGQCQLWEKASRRLVLRAWPWGWARKRSSMSLLLSPPSSSDQWSYRYQLPSDCIRVVFIGNTVHEKADYVRRGLEVYTNEQNAVINYVYDLENYGAWPDDAAMAMAARLAVFIAPSVSTEQPVSAVRQEAMREFGYWMKVAASADGNEQKNDRGYYMKFRNARTI